MTSDLSALLDQLRQRGLRVTTPRRAVLEALVEVGPHPTADDLAAHVAGRHPEVHLSTVYRTLDTLTELGIVSHVHLGHGGAAYHLGGSTNLHVTCDRCGTVAHVPASVLQPAADEIAERTGFELRPGHFALTGRCSSCRSAFEAETARG